MRWEYTLSESELASLEAALDGDTLDLIIVGKPSKIKRLSLGVTTLTIVDPISEAPPPSTMVPEPSTVLLIGSGLIGLWWLRRKFKK